MNYFITAAALTAIVSIAPAFSQETAVETERSERLSAGIEKLDSIFGEGTSARVQDTYKESNPDLADYAIEFAYGDVFQRPQMDTRTRELVIISSLAAMGGVEAQLLGHMHVAMNLRNLNRLMG